jgi:hypothetical protein
MGVRYLSARNRSLAGIENMEKGYVESRANSANGPDQVARCFQHDSANISSLITTASRPILE